MTGKREHEMETKVTFIYDYQSIEIPEHYRTLTIPDIEPLVEAMCQELAAKQSSIELPEGQPHILTDEMVAREEIPGIETVEDYRLRLREALFESMADDLLHTILIKYVMPELVKRSTFEINDEEATRISQQRLESFEKEAMEEGLTLEEAVRREVGTGSHQMDEGMSRQYMLHVSRTGYLFEILAREYYSRQGKTFDLASYYGQVKSYADLSGRPEEEIRELLPVHEYMALAPARTLLDEMSGWLAPQITLKLAAEDQED